METDHCSPCVAAPSGPSAIAQRVTRFHFISLRGPCVKQFIIQAADEDLVFTETRRLG